MRHSMGLAVLGVAVAEVGVVNRNPNETLKGLKKMLFLHLDLRLRIWWKHIGGFVLREK